MDFVAPGASASRPLGYQQIVGAAVSTALTVPDGTCYVILKPVTQAIRIRDDGVAPTAAVGYPIPVGIEYIYTGSPAALRLIEQAASATIDILYYGKY